MYFGTDTVLIVITIVAGIVNYLKSSCLKSRIFGIIGEVTSTEHMSVVLFLLHMVPIEFCTAVYLKIKI